jgi:hypothetical protein
MSGLQLAVYSSSLAVTLLALFSGWSDLAGRRVDSVVDRGERKRSFCEPTVHRSRTLGGPRNPCPSHQAHKALQTRTSPFLAEQLRIT